VGRKTGALRRCALIRIKDGDRYLVVGSMGGAPKHPVWYLNLLADPDVTIQDRDEVHELRARPATPAERAELWPVATKVWPAYDDYQAKTDREIPLVICEPRS
jgi:deazaflavin-dependent oxidoreductase (nitroreductase family)